MRKGPPYLLVLICVTWGFVVAWVGRGMVDNDTKATQLRVEDQWYDCEVVLDGTKVRLITCDPDLPE